MGTSWDRLLLLQGGCETEQLGVPVFLGGFWVQKSGRTETNVLKRGKECGGGKITVQDDKQ